MQKRTKTTTYSLDWDTVMNLESRLLRDFQTNKTKDKARALLMISIGVRLGMRVIDNLNLKWEDLLEYRWVKDSSGLKRKLIKNESW